MATGITAGCPSKTHIEGSIDDQGTEDHRTAVARHHHERVTADPANAGAPRERPIEGEVGVAHDDAPTTGVGEELLGTLEGEAQRRIGIGRRVAGDPETIHTGDRRWRRDGDHDGTASPGKTRPRVSRTLRTTEGEAGLAHPSTRDRERSPRAVAPGAFVPRDPSCRDHTPLGEARLDAPRERAVVSRTSRS